jgi:hypothetical protein
LSGIDSAIENMMTRPLRAAEPRLDKGALLPSRPVTADRRYYESFRPCASIVERQSLQLRYYRPRGVAACAFPFRNRDDRFQGSVSEPDPRSRRLKAGRHADPKQDLAGTSPGTGAMSRF